MIFFKTSSYAKYRKILVGDSSHKNHTVEFHVFLKLNKRAEKKREKREKFPRLYQQSGSEDCFKVLIREWQHVTKASVHNRFTTAKRHSATLDALFPSVFCISKEKAICRFCVTPVRFERNEKTSKGMKTPRGRYSCDSDHSRVVQQSLPPVWCCCYSWSWPMISSRGDTNGVPS